MKGIAAEALLAAVNEGLPVPQRARLVWQWLLSVPVTAPWRTTEFLGQIVDDGLADDPRGVAIFFAGRRFTLATMCFSPNSNTSVAKTTLGSSYVW